MKLCNTLTLTLLCCIASGQKPACDPPTEVRRALSQLPNLNDYRVPLEERLKPLRALAVKYPDDLAVQQRYQDAFRSRGYLYEEFDRAFAAYAARRGDPVARYLEARLTASFHPAKAGQMYQDLLARQPDFAWPHAGLAELTDRSGARDPAKAADSLRAFLTACPSSIAAHALLRTVDDAELIRAGAVTLRELLERERDAWSLPYWRYLWDLEFRAAAKEDKEAQEAVRRRVPGDAAALEKVDSAPSREWYWLFQYAADLAKDESIRGRLEERVLREFPDSSLVPTVDQARWWREHPRPQRGAPREALLAFGELERQRLEERHAKYPNDYDVILDRWFGLSGTTVRPLNERLAIVDAFIALVERSPDSTSSTPPTPVLVAAHYMRWQTRTEQAPELVQAGLREVEMQRKYALDPSAYPREMQNRQFDPVAATLLRARLTMADYYLLKKMPQEAGDVIQMGILDVDARPIYSSTSPEAQRDREFRRREWYPRQARLAALKGNAAQALEHYRRYMQEQDKRVLTGEVIMAPEYAALNAEAKQAYLASGGSDEKWVEWASSGGPPPAAAPRGLEYATALADFEAKDTNGKVWRRSDLLGKATFIDIWATWCGPCRAEHPELQKLQAALRDRKDIQVLTFSVDETEFRAASYLQEQRYTFPAIVSKTVTDKLFPAAGLPQAWIIDAQGRRSSPYRLFSVEGALAELEKAAKAR